MSNQYCVIMAGGSGTRLWPVSKAECPKQFLQIEGKSFFQKTYERFCTIVPPENIIVVTLTRYRDMVLQQVPQILPENILCEPYGRNTAPTIAFATAVLMKKDPEAVMVVTPSDHIIDDDAQFRAEVLSALEFASHNDVLVTLGITPTRPDPNFGYIQALGGKGAYRKGDPLPVKTFTEKPNAEIARVFVESGEFLWNSGIFVWKVTTINDEMDRLMPGLSAWFEGWEDAMGTPSEAAFINRIYGSCERISIDYGVMEKTDRAWVYPVSFGWHDVGTWESMYSYIPSKDEDGNIAICDEKAVEDCEGTLAITRQKGKMIFVKGLKNYMVIDTENALMVCPRDEKQFNDLISTLALPEYQKYR